jgi:hypothetical protein
MDLYPTETVLLDGDTWFRKSPSKLFKRISTQSTLLHANEGIIDNMRGSKAEALKGFLDAMNRIDDQYGENLPTRHSRMWNAGVIGLHLSHRPLLDQVLAITDFLCEHSQLHVLEQLAFSHVLPRNSHTIECLDTVFHYWPPYIHQPFRQKIETLLTETKSLSEHTRLSVLYRNRPRPTNTRRGLVLAKRLLELLRLKEKSVRSNEW